MRVSVGASTRLAAVTPREEASSGLGGCRCPLLPLQLSHVCPHAPTHPSRNPSPGFIAQLTPHHGCCEPCQPCKARGQGRCSQGECVSAPRLVSSTSLGMCLALENELQGAKELGTSALTYI